MARTPLPMNEIRSFVIDMLRGLVHARHGGVRCSANRTRASCDNVIYARTAHIRCRVETADSVSPIVASPASALFIGHPRTCTTARRRHHNRRTTWVWARGGAQAVYSSVHWGLSVDCLSMCLSACGCAAIFICLCSTAQCSQCRSSTEQAAEAVFQ